jgi:hypothetical protein
MSAHKIQTRGITHQKEYDIHNTGKIEIKNIRFIFIFYCRQVFVFKAYISHGQLNKGEIFLPNINMSRLVNSRTLIPTWFSPSYISDFGDRIKVSPTKTLLFLLKIFSNQLKKILSP